MKKKNFKKNKKISRNVKNKDEECKHRRIKKNYNFGRKSTPVMFCKDCGKIITPHLIVKSKKNKY